jgi:hypothetical protein
MQQNVVFKVNAGIDVGNYHLGRCRHITDEADRLLAGYLKPDLLSGIELVYQQTIRTR